MEEKFFNTWNCDILALLTEGLEIGFRNINIVPTDTCSNQDPQSRFTLLGTYYPDNMVDGNDVKSKNPKPIAMSSDTQTDSPAARAERSTAGDANRKIRKRAKRACVRCRTRKVRCDVVLAGTPCTNCKLDGEECVIRPSTHRW